MTATESPTTQTDLLVLLLGERLLELLADLDMAGRELAEVEHPIGVIKRAFAFQKVRH